VIQILQTLDFFITSGVIAVIVAASTLVLLRSLFKYLDVNPFTWSAITVKRLTDPVVLPVRRLLVAMRVDPIIAPVIAILIFILVGFFVIQISSGFLNTIAGVFFALTSGKPNFPIAIMGYLLYALIGLYELMIFARIIGIWFSVSYANRTMRFLSRTTEPLLAPLRRVIPTVSMFDISPMIAFLILWLLQAVVAGTLLKGWPVRLF
jgi:YggT family protein